MKGIRERYQNDPAFRMLVNYLEEFIHKGQYTPTELREAAILAHIRYSEYSRVPIVMNQTLQQFLEEETAIKDNQ